MVKVIVKRNVEERGLGIFNREAKMETRCRIYILPALGTHGPRREPVVNCTQKDWHNHITQTQTHTDIGDQYSATINVRDRPSRVRTCLICKIESP